MNQIKKLFIFTAPLLILVALTMTALASQPKRKQQRSRRATAQPPARELVELVRRAQESASQAQAEARRAREQGEEIARRLAQATQEIASLRQGIADCGLRIAELSSEVRRSQSLAHSPPPATDNPQSAIRNPQTAPDNPQSAIRNPQSEDGRIAKLEEQVEINAAQLKEQAQTKVESDSRFRVRLFGMILANTYFNTDESSPITSPTTALPPAAAPASRYNFGATLRQTRFGLAMDGPEWGGARLGAEVEFDFFGGTLSGQEGDVLGALRLRTASARIAWERTSLVVGQTAPLISPLNPTSLALVWFPAMTAAGNLWQWRPQITLEHRARLDDRSELVLQGGVMMPFGETVNSVALSGKPSYESRLAFRRSVDAERRLELGAGAHLGRRSFTFGRRVDSYIVAGDWLIPLHERLELSGEAYYGRSVSLGEISGGRIDRIFALSGPLNDPATVIRGIHTAGGWAQLSLQARRDLELNFAYGQEDPRNRDLRAGVINNATRLKNQVASANFIYQFRPNLLVSLEYRRLRTDYPAVRRTNGHVNLAVGYVF